MAKYDEHEVSGVREIDVLGIENALTGGRVDAAEAWLAQNDPDYANSRKMWTTPSTDALARHAARDFHPSMRNLSPIGEPGSGCYIRGYDADDFVNDDDAGSSDFDQGTQCEAPAADPNDYPEVKTRERASHWKADARRLWKAGWSKRRIARHLGVDEKSVRNVLSGK